MLTTNITLAEKYDYLSDKFKKAFTFLRETDLASLPIGRTEIDGDEVYASVQSYTTMTVEECAFESHLEYFDVQYVVEGEECFGYEPVTNLSYFSFVINPPSNNIFLYDDIFSCISEFNG